MMEIANVEYSEATKNLSENIVEHIHQPVLETINKVLIAFKISSLFPSLMVL